MARNGQKKYAPEFKREALRLLETSGKSVPQLERELGITEGLLYKWKQRYQIDDATNKVKPSDQQALEAENRRLRRELDMVNCMILLG
jgi:transposase